MDAAESFDSYSEIADQQLDDLESKTDVRLYNEVLKVCNQIFDEPDSIKKFSSVITTTEGLRFSTSVPGGYPYRVYWSMSMEGLVRIEAVFVYTN